MSSYDCVLPIREAELIRVLEALPENRVSAFLRAAEVVPPVWKDPFYGHVHSRPELSVVGCKNGFHFRELDRQWLRERHIYRCVWQRPDATSELLDRLLHGLRTEPPLAGFAALPAYDDPLVLGYLRSREVVELDAMAGPLVDNPHTEALRRLIQAAAKRDLALVALQGGL